MKKQKGMETFAKDGAPSSRESEKAGQGIRTESHEDQNTTTRPEVSALMSKTLNPNKP